MITKNHNKKLLITILFFFLTLSFSAPCSDELPNSAHPDGFCPRIWTTGLSFPRGMVVASNGDILVLEAGQNRVVALYDNNGDGYSDINERSVIATASGLNHGIDIFGGYLYASNPTTVFRWKYYAGNRSNLGNPQTVITNIPCCHHTTRTLRFSDQGDLYVQSGSGSNVDSDPSHSQVRRFTISSSLPMSWSTGTLAYNGLRNEVGLRYDMYKRLWGVENGCDMLQRSDLGGDIHNDNPSEEVNLFDKDGFYGYPYCWSEGKLDSRYAKGPGTQRYHPDFKNYTDNWCAQNSIKPAFNLQAHTAPLDILFYYDTSFPEHYRGNAFVTLHGSWNRDPPVGYRIQHLIFDKTTHLPTSVEDFMYHKGNSARWPNNIRPVGLGLAKCSYGNCLYMTSDASGNVIEISYRG